MRILRPATLGRLTCVRYRAEAADAFAHHAPEADEEIEMTLGMILLVILVLLLIGVVPSWPHSRGWGYGPSGVLGVVLLVVVVLMFLGRV